MAFVERVSDAGTCTDVGRWRGMRGIDRWGSPKEKENVFHFFFQFIDY